MIRYNNGEFINVTIDIASLETNGFNNCVFDNVRFIGKGVTELSFNHCTFLNSCFECENFDKLFFDYCDLNNVKIGSKLSNLLCLYSTLQDVEFTYIEYGHIKFSTCNIICGGEVKIKVINSDIHVGIKDGTTLNCILDNTKFYCDNKGVLDLSLNKTIPFDIENIGVVFLRFDKYDQLNQMRSVKNASTGVVYIETTYMLDFSFILGGGEVLIHLRGKYRNYTYNRLVCSGLNWVNKSVIIDDILNVYKKTYGRLKLRVFYNELSACCDKYTDTLFKDMDNIPKLRDVFKEFILNTMNWKEYRY